MANIAYDDFSGDTSSTSTSSNPYDTLLQSCNNSATQIKSRYQTHRTTRNSQQRARILSPDFPGWILDPILTKLQGPSALRDPSFIDPRHCLVFWARPPKHIKSLIHEIQQRLLTVVPGVWLMPLDNLHLTVMEIAHSLSERGIGDLVALLQRNGVSEGIADLPRTLARGGKKAKLISPMVSFDGAALALSFLPTAAAATAAAATAAASSATDEKERNDDGSVDASGFTYHHLRRGIYEEITSAGVNVGSRYVVPSAHLTIARFNSPNPFVALGAQAAMDGDGGKDIGRKSELMALVDEVNGWLEREYWGDGVEGKGEWVVGDEKGLDFRRGTLWYGGGETVYLGKAVGAP